MPIPLAKIDAEVPPLIRTDSPMANRGSTNDPQATANDRSRVLLPSLPNRKNRNDSRLHQRKFRSERRAVAPTTGGTSRSTASSRSSPKGAAERRPWSTASTKSGTALLLRQGQFRPRPRLRVTRGHALSADPLTQLLVYRHPWPPPLSNPDYSSNGSSPCHGCVSRAAVHEACPTSARLKQPWHTMNHPG
jgi:hypothetical protein